MTGTNQSGFHDSLVIVLFQIRNRPLAPLPLLGQGLTEAVPFNGPKLVGVLWGGKTVKVDC